MTTLKIVVDTNVMISAILSPRGNAAKIINIIADNEEIKLFYSAEIMAEYREVLSRKRLNIDPKKRAAYIEAIKDAGIEVEPAASDISLPDESDRIFYDVALKTGAILITGNKKHYPDETFIKLPAEFLRLLDKLNQTS